MKYFNKTVEFGKFGRRTGVFVFLMLLLGCQLFFVSAETGFSYSSNPILSVKENAIEIQKMITHQFLPIELTNSFQSITKGHRLGSQVLFSCKLEPIKSIFKNSNQIWNKVSFINPIPIFIRGHSLLN